jgi:SSS family solute:Na+ symporter
MDFVRRWRPQLQGMDLVRVSRFATFTFALLAVLWAPQIERFGSLWQYVQGCLAYVVPPVTALYLVGLFWRRANGAGASAALVVGVGAGIALFCTNVVWPLISIQFLYVAPLLFALSTVTLIVVSLATAPESAEKTDGLVWTPAFFAAESELLRPQPFWRNYRFLGGGLLLLTGIIVVAFR